MKHLFIQFTKYASVGAIGTIAQYLTLVALAYSLRVNPVLASTIGYIIGTFINYLLNFSYTFKSNKSHNDAMPKFFTVALVGLGLNSGMMSLFIKYFGIHYFYAQILATCFVLLWTFGANRLWTFRDKPKSMENVK